MKCYIPISDIEAHCFSFLPCAEDARIYLLRSRGQALCVDPCVSEEAERLLEAWGIPDCTVILTHEHYDHTSGVNRLREICRCNVICSDACGRLIRDPRRNLSQYAEAQYINLPEDVRKAALAKIAPFSCSADATFSGEMRMDWGGHTLTLTETLGHSKGSICIRLDESVVFTGDSLVPHTPVVTRLPGGSKPDYYQHALPYLQSLPPDTWALPGHFDGGRLGDLMKEVESIAAGK